MKIVATVTDVTGVVHAGSSPESRSWIIEVPDENVPERVRQAIENEHGYNDVQFSILMEGPDDASKQEKPDEKIAVETVGIAMGIARECKPTTAQKSALITLFGYVRLLHERLRQMRDEVDYLASVDDQDDALMRHVGAALAKLPEEYR